MDTTLRLMDLLKRLNDAGVEFVVIGGVAAIAHGSARVTADLDVCAPLKEPNISRILDALRGIRPRHRMRPDKPPLPDDPARFKDFKNLNVLTELGIIDILSEVNGVGAFDQVVHHSMVTEMGDMRIRILDLDALIAAKQAANRPKDRVAVTELKIIREKGRRQNEPPQGD
jgi:predicted nucleotidyltransferase